MERIPLDGNLITILNTLAILLSPLIALIVSEFLNDRKEFKKRKYMVLENLIAYRYNTTATNFLTAINSIPIIFKDHRNIKELCRKFYETVKKSDKSKPEDISTINQQLTDLILKICKTMGYSKNVIEQDIKEIFLTT